MDSIDARKRVPESERKGVMCNLGEGLVEETEERIARVLIDKEYPLGDIAEVTGLSLERVEELAEKLGLR